LEKIIQLPFYIPSLKDDEIPNDIRDYITSAALENIERPKELLKFLPKNIRKIKRIFNRFSILSNIIKEKDHNAILLALLIFQSNWPDFFVEMTNGGEPYFNLLYHSDKDQVQNPKEDDFLAQRVNKAMKNDKFNYFFNKVMRRYLMEYHKARQILDYLPLLGEPLIKNIK
jgi:hypothetical protein